MGITQFPHIQYFLQLTSSGIEHPCGSFIAENDGDIGHMQLYAQKVGAHVGAEKFRVKLFSDGNYDGGSEYAISDWVSVSDIDTLTSSAWYGNILFDFARQPLVLGDTYYLSIETENYSKESDDSYYWSFALDWPNDINTSLSATSRALQFSLLDYVQ